MPWPASFLSGILVALSFPTVIFGIHLPDLSWLAWIALVPLLLACRNASPPKAALLAFLAGLLYNSLVCYWMFTSPYTYGRWSVVTSLAGLILQSSLWALMLAIALLPAFWLARRRRPVPLLIGLPICWTVYEWLRNYGPFGGNPWTTLGYSQADNLRLIQSADLFGVYGLTFLIVFVNLVFLEIVAWATRRRPFKSSFPGFATISALVLLMANLAYGHWRLQRIDSRIRQAETQTIGLIQPNIPQEVKFVPKQAPITLRVLSRLTEQAVNEGAPFVIWPEQAIAQVTFSNVPRLSQFSGWSVPVLVGAVTSPVMTMSAGFSKRPLQNSAILVEPGGRIGAIYHKMHLVPFGEYVPVRRVFRLFGIKEKAVPAYGGDFIPAKQVQLLSITNRSYGVTICFEDLFPEISRSYADRGADFLVNMTNDAWYGASSEPRQHLNFSRFRAVENRRSMVRATNNGITAVIDPAGRIQAQLPPFEEGTLVASVPVGGPKTFYTRYRNAPWLILSGLVLIIGIVGERGRDRGRPGEQA